MGENKWPRFPDPPKPKAWCGSRKHKGWQEGSAGCKSHQKWLAHLLGPLHAEMLSVFLSCIAPVISTGFSIAAGPELQQCPCTARMRTFPLPSGPPALSLAARWHLVQFSKPKGVFLVIRLFLNLCYHPLLRGAQGFKFPRWLSSRTKGQL